ncbi:MAG TPA: mannosyltransferase family protein [Candidatus Binatia bacterium]|nr:mannosyltransferase family protein [Candidatus Binatia bacterium]
MASTASIPFATSRSAARHFVHVGWLELVAVLAGGTSLGFFLWYGFISRYHAGALLTELSFLVALCAGVAAALAGWQWYGRYFARRSEVELVDALRFDAISWATLLAMWLTFILPGAGATGRSVALAAGLFCLAKLAVATRFNRTVRDVSITFLVTRVPIIVIAELASVIIAQRPGEHSAVSSTPILAVWGRWDAVHYLDIARQGYFGTDMAFFPLYPMLIAVVGGLVGSNLIAALVISNAALFFGLLFFYKLVEHQYNRHVAQRAVFYISIFPTAIFFSAVYTEALFFALTVASFYYIRERHWVTAGIIGFFAAMARVEGILLAVPFALEWYSALRQSSLTDLRSWPEEKIVRPAIGLALIPAGLVSYMAYLWVLRGDPLYFSHVQIFWDRHLAWPWTSIWHSWQIITHVPNSQIIANQALELAFTALMIGVLIGGFRRLLPSYWWYMALSILIPMSTSSLMSMPRFALVLFPMFVVLALWGERHSVNNAIVAFSLPLLGLFTVLFADWYWVA